MDLLSPNFADSPEVVELQGAFNTQVEAIAAVKDDLFNQLDIATTTWGLTYWEKVYGLKSDVSKPYDYRRTRIMSKMRGQGSTTKAMIQNVAESFSNGQVDVLVYPNEYRFEIKFTGTLGIPPNMENLTAAIEEIKPAHLAYNYVIIYRIHAQLTQYTHAQLAAYTHKQLREEVLV
ncbi:MAG: putative phage tail protein [Peptococcaceae bacterium]